MADSGVLHSPLRVRDAGMDGVLLFFWAVDLARLPKAAALTVSRRWARPLSLDMETTVSITVQTPALGVGAAQVIDAAPPAAVDEVEELPFQLDRLWWSAPSYRVKPRQRGDLQFGPAYLRYQSKLGLAERWAKADLSQTVRVYPNLQETLQNSIYLLKNRQMETERRLLRLRGQATEFESLREYRLGDDYRAISWTATARRSRLVVRQFQAERSQPIWIVLDCGRLMRTETGRISKLDYAVNAALNVTQVAMYGGDKVGLLAYGRRPRQQMLPGRGALHLHNMIELSVAGTCRTGGGGSSSRCGDIAVRATAPRTHHLDHRSRGHSRGSGSDLRGFEHHAATRHVVRRDRPPADDAKSSAAA